MSELLEKIEKYKETRKNEDFKKIINSEQIQRMIKFKLDKFKGYSWADFDFLYQQAIITIWEEIDNYDSSKSKPMQFFSNVVYKKFVDLLRYYNRKKRGRDFENVSFEKSLYEDSEKNFHDFLVSAEDINYDNLKLQWFLKQLTPELSELELKSLALFCQGYEYQEIAKKLGKHFKAIDNALQRVRSKARDKATYRAVASF